MKYNLVQSYIKELNQVLKDISFDTEKMIADLVNYEAKFVKRLLVIAGGKQVYKDFINYILHERDLREVRPFFRERENMYKNIINKAISKRTPEVLHKMKVNFLFCSFAIKRIKKEDKKLLDIFNKIKEIRENLIHNHLHYALNRAKSFNRYMSNYMEFSDLIQIANEAIIMAVDKYVPSENSPAFHTVLIGRMISNLIFNSDQTSIVSLGAKASLKLYQIKRLLEKTPNLSTKEISDIIGILEEEVASIINATYVKSLDESLNNEDASFETPSITLLDFLPSTANENTDPYLIVEKKDLLVKAAEVFKNLTILEQKVLRLKGINFKDYY